MEYGLLGRRLGHSFSCEIHRRIGEYPYVLCEVEPEGVADFMARQDFHAINVTIPYKETVIPYLAELDPASAEIGAVNTVVRHGGRLVGYNTDFDGMRALMMRLSVPVQGKKTLVLGTGGTSLTAVAVLRALGADPILRVGRSGKDGSLTYAEAIASHADAQVLINTTPVGMYPNSEGMPIDLASFPQLQLVVDAVYNPLRTDLVLSARERGIPASGGLYMLVAQAISAAMHFGVLEERSAVLADRIYRELCQEKENIVLVGMPGSGKTTVGRALAARTGRPLIDLDEEILREAGKSIPEIFAECGEVGFRDIETAVLKKTASEHTGAVISTGGGAILREENRRALHRTGRVFFLDRPLETILPTESRPLSSDREALAARYRERYPIYMKVADCRIPVAEGDVDGAVAAILAAFSEGYDF